MADQLGEKLTELDRGDSVAVTIDGARYASEVIETRRWKCELKHGFMESGSISIRIELSADTIDRHDLSTEFLSITATETAPRSWKVPEASAYDPIEREALDGLGAVTDVEI